MPRQSYQWALLIGVLLLAAGVFFAHADTDKHAAAYRSLAVAQAVADLERCMTCHDAPAPRLAAEGALSTIQLVDYSPARTIELHASPASPTFEALAAQRDALLLDLGRRILAVEPEDGEHTAAYAAVVDDFLGAYDTRDTSAPDDATLLTTLRTLAGLEQRLRTLEHQASPYRLERAAPPEPQRDQAASPPVPVPAPAAISHPDAIQPQIADQHAWHSTEHGLCVVPCVTYAVHRRGPPAGVGMESVSHGRLPLFDAQSPFFALGAPGPLVKTSLERSAVCYEKL
ncbi:MAG: hypothetical protein GXY36_01285 [Chloroflexi bacterium]|nr:hypothetical protein [Chloroflexota bacterium]